MKLPSLIAAPLPWVVCGSLAAMLVFIAAILHPLPLLAAAAAAALGAVLGAALVLAALWRRFDAAAPEAREAILGSLAAVAATLPPRVAGRPSAPVPIGARAPTGPVPVTLALQGGGSLGFWRRVAVAAGSPDAAWGGGWFATFAGLLAAPIMAAPVLADALRQASRGLPRTQVNPLGLNPLRGVLDGLLDPSAFGKPGAPALVVSATRVRTGEARLFRDAEVTAEALLASACLPQVFPAVEIDGEAYWDGGYASNPPLRALVEAGAPSDIVLVRTTPVERPDPPAGAAGVLERADEMVFAAAVRQELRSLAVAQRLLADLPSAPPGVLARLRDARLHAIGAEDEFRALKGGSQRDASWAFLQSMRDLGHRAADRWLGEHLADVGVRSTVDLAALAGPVLEPGLDERLSAAA